LSHFAVPAISPCILNLSLIFAALVICPHIVGTQEQKVYGLAAGVLMGGILQFCAHLPILKRKGVPLSFRFSIKESWNDPVIRRILKLMVPGMIGLSINQINVIVDRFLSFLISNQAAAVLFYGDRLVEFPLGVFGIAFATAVLPALSRHAARKDLPALKKSLNYALRQIFFITVPATIGLLVLAPPIVQLLFERGSFTAQSTFATAWALRYYALGLVAYSGIKMVVPAFYALKDMKTPIRIGFVALGVNVVLNLILMWPMKEQGLALSTSIAAYVNLGLLIFYLEKKIGHLAIKSLLLSFGRIFIVSLVMGLLGWFVWHQLFMNFGDASTWPRLVCVLGSISMALLAYFVMSLLFRIPELSQFKEAFSHRSKNLPDSEPSEEPPLRGE